MFYNISENQNIKKIIQNQMVQHRNQLNELKILLKDKNIFSIKNDYKIFCEMNQIFFDKNRKFIKYENDILLNNAKKDLNNIINKLNFGVNSYCDIGCGCGHFPRAGYELGINKNIGIDIYRNKRWDYFSVPHHVTYKCSDITKDISQNDKFELVTSLNAFEHFENPIKMLESISYFVEDTLYIKFSPIYNSSDGHHMYRHIQIPWYHLIFSKQVIDMYYKNNNLESLANINYFNKWSSLDFIILFSSFKLLRLESLIPIWDRSKLWFMNEFPHILPQYSIDDLMCTGFEVIYKKIL